jgi:N-acetylmuramoyl-L-alanine amidase
MVNRLDAEKNLLPLAQPWLGTASRKRVIVIDPGHGGLNPGTQAAAGKIFEKTLTLDWAMRLRALLESRGWQVLMTRTNDADVSLAERVDFAESSHADLFVSLHFNSGAGNREAQGIETYCLTPQGMSSTIRREYIDDSGKKFPNNEFDADNLRLAMSVHRSLLGTTGARDRGVRRARFMDVVRWQSRPAILVEGGYLTNPIEARSLAQPAYRQKLAEAVARGLE